MDSESLVPKTAAGENFDEEAMGKEVKRERERSGRAQMLKFKNNQSVTGVT